jgi:hypothetical protein
MDILQSGSEKLEQLKAMSCCWPPGVENAEQPALEE